MIGSVRYRSQSAALWRSRNNPWNENFHLTGCDVIPELYSRAFETRDFAGNFIAHSTMGLIHPFLLLKLTIYGVFGNVFSISYEHYSNTTQKNTVVMGLAQTLILLLPLAFQPFVGFGCLNQGNWPTL